MKTIPIHSYEELAKALNGSTRACLLLYKSGSGQSGCALDRINRLRTEPDAPVYTADVSSVQDIHLELQVRTAPTLVVFQDGKISNMVKGCQTESVYDSILSGRDIGMVPQTNGKPAGRVTVYTTPTCSWCTTLKTYLDSRSVSYREINVAEDASAAEAMVRRSGQQGVPQTEINGQMVVGFDKNRLNQLLGIA